MRSMGFSLFGSSDKDVGNQVLTAYFNTASTYPGFPYQSYSDFLNYANTTLSEDFEVAVGNLVNLNSASTTASDAAARVADLASKSQGAATLSQIIMAAGGTGNSINWGQAFQDVASESALQVESTLQNVGSGALKTINLMQYLPWILAAGGAIYLFSVGQVHGETVRAFVSKKKSEIKSRVASARARLKR